MRASMLFGENADGAAVRSPFRRSGAGHFMEIESEAVTAGYAWLQPNKGTGMCWEEVASFNLYAIPAKAPNWVMAHAAERRCTVMGVVPHYRVVNCMRFAFFPEGTAPQPRQRLRIDDGHLLMVSKPLPGSTRKFTRDLLEIIHIDSWTPLKPETLYLDSDLQAGDVRKFYTDHLRVDDHLLHDLILPSTSAAYGLGGGIDLGARTGLHAGKAVQEFLWQLSAALPPEYRARPRLSSDAKGLYRQGEVGKFFFQDLPPPGSHIVTSGVFRGTDAMRRVLHRQRSATESSAYATLSVPPQGTRAHVKFFLEQLTTPHCIMPEPVDDLLRMDLDMSGFDKEISSSLWKAHAMLRSFQPLASNLAEGVVSIHSTARDALDLALVDMLPEENSRRLFVRQLMRSVPHRIEETALAIARLRGTNATRSDATEAFRLLDQNVTHALDHPDLQRTKLEVTEETLEVAPENRHIVDAFETAMQGVGPMYASAIVESLKGLPSLETEQQVLDALEALDANGFVYKQPDGRYVWIDT